MQEETLAKHGYACMEMDGPLLKYSQRRNTKDFKGSVVYDVLNCGSSSSKGIRKLRAGHNFPRPPTRKRQLI